MTGSNIPQSEPSAPARSFGRSTFKSSFLGASSLLAKNSSTNEELDTELQLQSNDDSDEQNNKENITMRPVPSVFLIGATQLTQIDMNIIQEDSSSETQTQTLDQITTDLQMNNLQEDSSLEIQTQTLEQIAVNLEDNSAPMEEEPQPEMPVVYASSGRMKVLGALPAHVVSSMVSGNGSFTSKSKGTKRGSKSKAPPKVHRNIDVEARKNYLAKIAAVAAAEAESATNPQRIKFAVSDLVFSRKDVAKDWTMKQWNEEVCSLLNVQYDVQDLQLRAYVKDAVMTSAELSDMVSSQTQSQEYLEVLPQSQISSQAAIQSQMEELFDGYDDNSDGDMRDKGPVEQWADADADDGADDAGDDSQAQAFLENQDEDRLRHWGDGSDDEDVFRRKKDKKPKPKSDASSKRDKKKVEKMEAKLLRREEKEKKRRAKAGKKAALVGVTEGDIVDGASGSKANAKAANSDSDDGVDAPSSSSSDSDNQEDDLLSEDEEKNKAKQKKFERDNKISKKSKVPDAPKVTAVETEVAVMKTLDQGPSEAELRSRKLVTLDEDERLDRVFKMNQKAAQVLSKCQRRSIQDECTQLRKIKTWINEKRAGGDELIIEEIEFALERQQGDLNWKYQSKYNHNGKGSRYGAVGPIFFLKRDQEADDEEEYEDLHYILADEPEDDEADEVKKANVVLPKSLEEVQAADSTAQADDMVCLSGSEDEDEVDVRRPEPPALAVDATTSVQARVHPVIQEELTPQPIALHKQQSVALYHQQRDAEKERKTRIRQAMLAVRSIKSGTRRGAEKLRLRQQVAAKAEEEYCRRKHVSSEYFPVWKQIEESCRMLVDLLRERADRQQEKQRIEDEREVERQRRKRLRNQARYNLSRDAPEAEFDGTDAAPARVFTEEEIQMELLRVQEEDDEDYADGEEEDEETESLAPVDEELEAINGNESDKETLAEMAVDIAEESSNESGSEEGDQDQDQEEAQPRSRKLTKRGVINDDDDDDDDNVDVRSSEGASGVIEKASFKRSSDEVDDMDPSKGKLSEAQPNSDIHKDAQKERRKRSGNSLYRKMVEEEERRESQSKKNVFIDDAAEEDEEEGRQKGLNDFGFGTGTRDNDDEREALKVRAGDFDNIVDELSDDERDEADEENAMRMRHEQELKEDKEKNRRIVEGIIDGFDKTKRGRKGQMSFDKLVGDTDNRAEGVDANGDLVEGLDEEEQLQRMLSEGITSREQLRRMAGNQSDDSDDDPEEEGEEHDDDGTLTEEQRAAKIIQDERKREERRQEKMRLRNLENAARIERMRRKQMMAQSQSQSQAQGPGLSRTISSQSQSQTNLLSGLSRTFSRKPTLTLTLGIEDDDFLLAPVSLKRSISAVSSGGGSVEPTNNNTSSGSNAATTASAGATEGLIPESDSTRTGPIIISAAASAQVEVLDTGLAPVNLSIDTTTATSTVGAFAVFEDSQSPRLRNITNTIGSDAPAPPMVIKRRTGMPPKRIEPKHIGTNTIPATSALAQNQAVKRTKTMYSGELNASEVEAGFGMGMALPAARRKPASDGLFSAVTGLKRVDSGIPSTGGIGMGMGMGMGRPVQALKKIRVGSGNTAGGAVTVSAQQYVFGATSMTSHDEGSHMASNFGCADSRAASSSGWDNSKATAAMASRMGAPAGGLSRGFPLPRTNSGLSSAGDEKSSLFAKLHKR